MKRFALYIYLSIFLCFNLNAQELAVSLFQKLGSDMTARVTNPVKDHNGKTCALIKVVNPNTGFVFDTGTLQVIKTEQEIGEVWVYVQPGVRKITVKHPQLGVLRDYQFPIQIEEATTYEMKLVSGTVTTVVTESTQQAAFLIINSLPEGADVYIDDKWEGNTPFSKKYVLGQTLDYRIVKNLYHDDIGKIKVDKTQTRIDAKLFPAFGTLTVTSNPSGAQVFLDRETQSAGMTPVTIKDVASGEHTIRVQKDKYAPAQEKVVILDGQTTTKDITLSARFAKITVKSIDGAIISVDGVRKGFTTATFDQMEGLCDIEAAKDGYRPAKKQIEVIAGQPQEITVNPTPIYGTLSVETKPMGAEITVDGKSYGTTPNIITDLLIGSHRLELELADYEKITNYVEIKENEEYSVSETLTAKKQYGTLSVTTNPSGATITIDGKNYGTTPKEFSLTEGTHKVILEKDGYEKVEKSISINVNKRTYISETLINKNQNNAPIFNNGNQKSVANNSVQSVVENDNKVFKTGTKIEGVILDVTKTSYRGEVMEVTITIGEKAGVCKKMLFDIFIQHKDASGVISRQKLGSGKIMSVEANEARLFIEKKCRKKLYKCFFDLGEDDIFIVVSQ